MAENDQLPALTAALAEVGITETTKLEHAQAPKVEDMIAFTKDKAPAGLLCAKNLFLRDKKAGMFLLTIGADTNIDMKALPGLLGISGSTNFRFGDAKLLDEKLKCVQGSVTPLAVMNEAAGDVKLVFDKKLLGAASVGVHPFRNDMTWCFKPDDLVKVCSNSALPRCMHRARSCETSCEA